MMRVGYVLKQFINFKVRGIGQQLLELLEFVLMSVTAFQQSAPPNLLAK